MSEKKKVDRSKLGKRNKTMGSNAERFYAKRFREVLGYKFCKTSRASSRLLDDSKVDLAFFPFNIQIKAGEQKGMKPLSELVHMKAALEENFPPTDQVHDYPKVVIHRKNGVPGVKRNEFMELVTMTYTDFEKILKLIPKNDN